MLKTIFAVGKRATGKTSLCLSYLKKYRYSSVLVFSQQSDAYNNINVPVFNQVDYNLINTFLQEQKHKKKHKPEPNNAIIIFDDCIHSPKEFFQKKCILEIIMNGRFSKITMIITTSYLMNIQPHIRINFDHCIFFREKSLMELEKIYKYFGDITNTNFNDFLQLHHDFTQRQGDALLIDQGSDSFRTINVYSPLFFSSIEFYNDLMKYHYNKYLILTLLPTDIISMIVAFSLSLSKKNCDQVNDLNSGNI
jgi:hypothetical protein